MENFNEINKAIRNHTQELKSWNNYSICQELYKWFDLFNAEFFNNKLEQCVISFEKRRMTNLGHYVIELNPYGLQDNININSVWSGRPTWAILFTLLHEMVHQYQRRLGSFSVEKENKPKSPNYHNKEFLEMTASFGMHHNKKGHRIKPPEGRFVEFLKKYGVECIEEEITTDSIPKGKSKLLKYSCECDKPINIRVASAKFSAICNHCKKEFKQQ